MRNLATDILVVGSGAGAAACVPTLAASGARVLVAERGDDSDLQVSDVIARGRRIFGEDGVFPRTVEGIPYYRRQGLGGTLDVSCANAVAPPAAFLARHGLELRAELDEVVAELGVTPVPDTHRGPNASRLAGAASALGYRMAPMPKFVDFSRCSGCALCELSCRSGAVWSAAATLKRLAASARVQVLERVTVTQLERRGDAAVAAVGVCGGEPIRIEAGAFVLAAGGLGTPVILQRSGIAAGQRLFLDLYVVVYGQAARFSERRELPMSAVYADPDGAFVLAPYVDPDLAHALQSRKLARWLPRGNLCGLMVKIGDDANGSVDPDGRVHKRLTSADADKLERGAALATRILLESGAAPDTLTRTAPRGAHPGGTAAYRAIVDEAFRVKGTRNVWVADASLLPEALGKPPIVTIMALARRVARSLIAAQA